MLEGTREGVPWVRKSEAEGHLGEDHVALASPWEGLSV